MLVPWAGYRQYGEFREALDKASFVVPAQAGTQEIQMLLDARLRGHDVN